MLALFLGVVPHAAGQGGYDRDARIGYIGRALEALGQTDIKTLENAYAYIDAMERNECRSAFHRLKIECLVATAQRHCRSRRGRSRRARCALYSDLIVTNKLSERRFVTTQDRYRIMKRYRDYRRQLRTELRRRYGSMAAGLSLSTGPTCQSGNLDCLPERIDDYCVQFADMRNLSWGHCVAALTWFVGTSAEGE